MKSHIQIFLDLAFKNYTRLMVSDETQSSELVKILKSKYATSSQATPVHSGSVHGGASARLVATGEPRKGSYHTKGGGSAKKGELDTCQVQKDEYSLYLINTKSANPILFVRRLAPYDLVWRIY